MATELTKPHKPAEQLATWRRSYAAAWETAFNETMFIMAEQYSMELLVVVEGKQVPSPTVKFWRESLQGLSPKQMREALRGYMASEHGTFKPNPELFITFAPDTAGDAPRVKINPNCPDCNGMGWRRTAAAGEKRGRVERCGCRVIEYDGQQYPKMPRQLLPVPIADPSKTKAIEDKLHAAAPAKRFPDSRPLSDEELAQKKSQAEAVARKYQG